jgi:hypothetical protein
MPRSPSDGPSPTHKWLRPEGRPVKLEPDGPLVHFLCVVCHRNFVYDLTTDEWHAVFPRLQDFVLLDHLTESWLSEDCPGQAGIEMPPS